MGIFMQIFLFFLFVFVLGLMVYLSRKSSGKLDNNLNLAAKILNSKVKQASFISQKVVEGDYKGRKIIFQTVATRSRTMEVKIIPRSAPRKQKKFVDFLFVVFLSKPTKNTYLEGKEIYYQESIKAHTEQEIIDIFEELSRAAEVVESNSPYYKK